MARVSFLHKDCIDLRRNKNKDIMEDDQSSVSVSAIICDIPKFDESVSQMYPFGASNSIQKQLGIATTVLFD